MGQETITLTTTELKKVLVIEKLVAKSLTSEEAATALGLSKRQVLRLKARYIKEGAKGIVHKNRGRKPSHTIPESIREQVVSLYEQKYYGSNNSHLSELLEEHEQLDLSVSSVRRILVAAGVKRQKQRRRPKLHSPRARKPQAGMLWQIDASKHDWLEGRSPAFALLAAIDDATGLVVGAVFRSEETTEGYFEVMRQGIRTYGIPAALYSDRHSIFKSRNEKATIEQELAGEEAPLSNFGQAMRDLGISHPKARSPQAKGRIERLWGTLQDRLLVELRILGVTSLEEANRVLPQLIAKHNKRFAVKPEQTESMYRKLDTNLDLVFCMREMRSVGPGQTISYGGKIYTLQTSSTRQTIPPKTRIEVRLNMKGKLFAWYQGQALGLKEAEKPKQAKPTPEKKKADLAPPHKPAANHPWRVWRGPKELNRALQKQD